MAPITTLPSRASATVPPAPTPFQPNQAQLRFAETLCRIASDEQFRIRPAQVCRQSGVNPRTYYRWQRQPGFAAWLAGLAVRFMAVNAPLLVFSTFQCALDGDNGARRLLFRKFFTPQDGLLPPEPGRPGPAPEDEP
ncbi:MAG: phBC6A51 family helix-turn-helix protein [Terriglobales bacterium]